MKIITKRQIIILHSHLINETGGIPGIRDEGLLESALAAPFAGFGEEEIYPTLCAKAARLGYGLVKNHPFIDGNKRVGAHSMLVFLAINGVEPYYTQKELSEVFLKIASDKSGYEELLMWLHKHETDTPSIQQPEDFTI